MDAMIVGIDVSKDRLDVAVRPTGESFVFKRTSVGIEELIARLEFLSPKMVAIEATGGFEAVVAAGLAGAGLPVVVVNSAQVRAFAQALGKRAKTHPIDAAVIAHFAEATKPKLRQMPDDTTRHLAGLVARRRQIVEMIAAEGQRASYERQAPDQEYRQATQGAGERTLRAGRLDRRSDTRIGRLGRERGSSRFSARRRKDNRPDPDRRTAGAWFAPPPTDRGPCRARALDPPIRTMVGGGRKTVRNSLFVGAMVAAHYNPQLKSFRDKLVAAGKPKLIALVAVARKLITILNVILRDRPSWQQIPA
jgi:transposase